MDELAAPPFIMLSSTCFTTASTSIVFILLIIYLISALFLRCLPYPDFIQMIQLCADFAHTKFAGFLLSLFARISYRMQRLSDITQRLLLVNALALVRPSPVLLAIVKVQYPSPPNPSAA